MDISARRSLLFDIALAAGLVAFAVAEAVGAPSGQWRVGIIEGLQAGSVGLRRVSPIAAAGGFLAGAIAEVAPPRAQTGDAGIVALLVLLYSFARFSLPQQRRVGMAILVAAIVALVMAESGDTSLADWLSDLVLVAMTSGGAFAIGLAMRRRGEREGEFALSTEIREQAWASRNREIVDDERRRIARELHDVVGHALAGIAVSAGAARRDPRSPPEVSEAMDLILTSTQQAAADMRRLVGLLRTESDTVVQEPQPTLDLLPALIETAHGAGIAVDFRVTGQPTDIGRSLQLVVYRIVQEGLTNATRHAPGTPVVVELHWEGRQIRVLVSDGGTAVSSDVNTGHGLTGLRERVLIHGGRFKAERGPAGGFVLEAVLPLS